MVSLEVFRSGGRMGSSISDSLGRCKLPDSVPAGKRLVIETVTGYYYGDGALLGTALLILQGSLMHSPGSNVVVLVVGPKVEAFMALTTLYISMLMVRPSCNLMQLAGQVVEVMMEDIAFQVTW